MNDIYIQNFMNRLDFPTEAKEEFMRIMDRIHTDQKLLARFDSAVYDYMQTSRDKALHLYTPSKSRNRHTLPDALNRMRILALQMEVSPYTLQFVFCMECSRLLLEIYQEKLIPEWIFWNTMEDFYCKLMECKNVMNVWGIFVAWWYDRFFDASRFGLGRLQFELEPFRGSKPLNIGGITICPGDPVINMHIPSKGPLTKALRQDAYRRAYAFFNADNIKRPMAFVGYSWLLYPKHEEFLPNGSNIVDFMHDFQILNTVEETEFSNGWRIFGSDWIKHVKDPNDQLPQNTALQKAYADWLLKGGSTGTGYGIFLYDGDEFWKN